MGEAESQSERVPAPRSRDRFRRGQSQAMTAPAARALLSAMELLSYRSGGADAWVRSFQHDPIAFLLDSIAEAVTVTDERGAVIYRNRAGMQLQVRASKEESLTVVSASGERYERRCQRFAVGRKTFVLEILHRQDESIE